MVETWATLPNARSLVVEDGSIKLRSCSLYAGHGTAVLEAHHICPHSWWVAAGKPVDTPMADLCGLCHNNTHAAIDGLVRGLDVTHLPPRTVLLATRALLIATDNGLTPRPTL